MLAEQFAEAAAGARTIHRDLLMAWSVDCSAKRQLAALATQYASIGAYRVTDELLVWSADGLRLANRAELAEYGRG